MAWRHQLEQLSSAWHSVHWTRNSEVCHASGWREDDSETLQVILCGPVPSVFAVSLSTSMQEGHILTRWLKVVTTDSTALPAFSSTPLAR